MTSVSISQLKKNPSAVFTAADDFPIAVQNRSKTAGYVVSEAMFEKLVELAENYVDKKAVEEADYKHGTPLKDLIEELGLE